jgi:hypothetical protein
MESSQYSKSKATTVLLQDGPSPTLGTSWWPSTHQSRGGDKLEAEMGLGAMGRRPEQGKRMAMETREELGELKAARRPGSSSRPWKSELGDYGVQGIHGVQTLGRAASLREAEERAGAGIEHGQELRRAFHGRSFGWALDGGKRVWEWLT